MDPAPTEHGYYHHQRSGGVCGEGWGGARSDGQIDSTQPAPHLCVVLGKRPPWGLGVTCVIVGVSVCVSVTLPTAVAGPASAEHVGVCVQMIGF